MLHSAACQVPDAQLYGTQDFRRGHAKDMQKSKQPMAKIRLAGGWESNSGPMPYLDKCELEQDMVLEIAIKSEDEEWIS